MRYFVSKRREDWMDAPEYLTIVNGSLVNVHYLTIGMENYIMTEMIRDSIRVNDVEITRQEFYKEMELMAEYRSKFGINN